MAKEVSTKNTKNEILDAYNELLEKIQSEKKSEPKAEKERSEKQEIIKNAGMVNFESIVKNISELKLYLGNALDKLEDSLIEEFKKLSNLQEAIKIESANLEELYQIKQNADSLAALLATQKAKKIEFDEEMKTKTLAWEKEQKDYEAKIKETDEQLKKNRKREEEEYKYNLELGRKKEQDSYNEKKTAQEKTLAEKKADFEKQIAERETAVSLKEKELEDLRSRVEAFPKELDKALKDIEKTVTDNLTSKYKFEKELLAKEIEGERKLKDQIILNLELKIKEQAKLIDQLTTKADHASDQVKNIAIKALDSSANIRYMNREKEKKEEEQ